MPSERELSLTHFFSFFKKKAKNSVHDTEVDESSSGFFFKVVCFVLVIVKL